MRLRSWLISLVLVGCAGAAGAYWVWHQIATVGAVPVAGTGEVADDLFVVPAGSTTAAAVRRLRDVRRIDVAEWRLRAYLRIYQPDLRIQAGEYLLAGRRLDQELAVWADGRVVQRQVTILPGLQYREILAALTAAPALQQTLADASEQAVLAAIGLASDGSIRRLDGLIHPDTYSYTAAATDVSVLRRAYQRGQTLLADAWQQRAPDLPYETPYEALIMASIVEKETGQESDRDKVAAVFVNRLNRGMRLQTDPTVIYALGASFDGNLKRRHLRLDHPYNTYVKFGLPPSPIASASTPSLHAALHPAEVDFLYFVARGDGTTQFSRTLREHERAVDIYQRRIRRR